MWHASKCGPRAPTTDSPGCKLGKAITAASAGSRLRLGDRMNNLHIPCAASVCGQISIWGKKKNTAPWQGNRYASALHCRALLVYTRVNLSLIGEGRFFSFFILFTSMTNLLDTRAALRLSGLVCSARASLVRRAGGVRWATRGWILHFRGRRINCCG